MHFKNIFLLLITSFAYSQVGIGTTNPQATLDIRGVNHLGTVASNDGILVPRVSSLSVNGTVNGQLVFLVSDSGLFTKGFHYWNGTEWIGIMKNIYSNDGIVSSSNRIVDLKPNNTKLKFDTNPSVINSYVHIGNSGAISNPSTELYVDGMIEFKGDSNYGVGKIYNDSQGEKYGLAQTTDGSGDFATRIYTSGRTGILGCISFGKYISATDFIEFARFKKDTGELGINTINPKSTLEINGTFAGAVTNNNTDTTKMYLLLNSGIFNPPAPNTCNGRTYIIRNTSTTQDVLIHNVVEFNTNTPSNLTLTPATGSVTIVSNGTNWYKI